MLIGTITAKVLSITNLELLISRVWTQRMIPRICYVSATGAAWLSHVSTRSATYISPKSGGQTQAECAMSAPTILVTTATSFPPPLSIATSAASLCSRASRRRGRRKEVERGRRDEGPRKPARRPQCHQRSSRSSNQSMLYAIFLTEYSSIALLCLTRLLNTYVVLVLTWAVKRLDTNQVN